MARLSDAGRPVVAMVNTNRIQPPIAPIAFDYLYEPLRAAGFAPVLLDLCFEDDWRAAIAQLIARAPPSFWGVTLRNTDDTYFSGRHSFLDLVRTMISEIRTRSAAPVVLGGVGFSTMPEAILGHCGADFGVVREGEVSFPALLTRLAQSRSPADVPGIVHRTAAGIVVNEADFVDLAEVPARARGFVDNGRYFAEGGMVAVETKRGCNRSCIYCVEPGAKGRTVRLRPPAMAVDEMERLADRGLDAFHINDSEFNLNVGHALAFCGEISRRGDLARRIRWYAYGMPHPFPRRLADAMVEAGCAGMNFGTDSADDRILRAIRRTFRRRHIAAMVETCRSAGLVNMIELLFGFPEETTETLASTIDFLRECDARLVSLTAGIRVFPGTVMAERVRAEGIGPHNPNLHGAVADNAELLKPLFYLNAALGPDPAATITDLVAGDPRFLPVNSAIMNYDDNRLLVDAIAAGARGAYWDILDRYRRRGRSRAAADAVLEHQ